MNHLAMMPTMPAVSVPVPILLTKSASPERLARSLNFTARRTAAMPFSTSPERNQPTTTINAKPMIFGIADRNIASAAASDVIIADPQSVIAGGIGVLRIVGGDMPKVPLARKSQGQCGTNRDVGRTVGAEMAETARFGLHDANA